jgi:hypothetical protein
VLLARETHCVHSATIVNNQSLRGRRSASTVQPSRPPGTKIKAAAGAVTPLSSGREGCREILRGPAMAQKSCTSHLEDPSSTGGAMGLELFSSGLRREVGGSVRPTGSSCDKGLFRVCPGASRSELRSSLLLRRSAGLSDLFLLSISQLGQRLNVQDDR